MRWGIRAKLTAVVLAVLLPLVLGALFKFWQDRRDARERNQERILLSAQVVARQLDEMLSGQLENLEALGAALALGRLQDDDLVVFLRRVRVGHPFVRGFVAASPDGHVLATSGPRATGAAVAVAGSRAVQDALRAGAPQVGAVQPSLLDGRPVVPLAIAVLYPTRAVRGVVVEELDVPALGAHLDALPLAGAGITLVSSDGALVARSETATRVAALLDTDEARRLLRQGAGTSEWRAPEDGAGHLIGAASLGRAPWLAIASVPSAAIDEAVASQLRTNLLGLAVVLAGGILVAWLIGRQMHRSVAALLGGGRALAAGRFTPITLESGDELAEVGEQFNRAFEGRRAAEAELETRQRRLEALAEVSLSLSQELDAERLLHRITDALARLTAAPVVVLWEVRPTEGRLVRRALTAEASVATVELPADLAYGEGATGWIAAHGEPVFIDDVTADPRVAALPTATAWAVRNDLLGLVGLPVEAGGQLVGVLTLNLRRGSGLAPEDRALLTSFASQAAVAIRNAGLFADASARREAAEAVATLGRVLAQALDPEELAPRVADSIRVLLGARASGLYRIEAGTGDLVALARSGDVPPSNGPARFPQGTGLVGLAVRERRPVATANLVTEDRIFLTDDARARLATASYRALLAVPLIVKGEVIGALAVGDREGRVFTGDEIRLAETCADQAGLALENARLYAEATRRRREAEELARVARMFTESLEVAELGRRVVDSVLPVLGAVSSGLCLLDADGNLRAVAWGGRSREHFAPDQVFPAGVGIMGRAAARGVSMWSRDVLAEPGLVITDDVRAQLLAAGNRAVLAVPLRVKGQLVGVLSVADAAVRDFTPAEVSLLEAFGDQVVVALENARLFDTVQRRRREAEELARVGRAFAQTLDPEGVAQQIVESLQIVFGVRTAVLLRLPPGGTELATWVSAGPLGDPDMRGFAYPQGTGLPGLAMRERRPIASADLLDDPLVPLDAAGRAALERAGIATGLAVPMMVHERIIGVLWVGDVPGHVFDEADVTLAQAFADEAALVLENARLFAEATRRRREAEELARAARVLTGSLAVSEVGQRMVDSVLPLFHARFARLRLKQPDGALAGVARAGTIPGTEDAERPLPAGVGVSGQAVTDGRPMRSADVADDPRIPLTPDVRAMVMRSGVRALAGVPLRVRGEIIGSLTIGDDLGRVFSDDEMVLLETFADQAALALDNARLYEQTRQRLRQLDSLREIVEQILGSFSLDDRLDLIARKAAEIVEGDRAAVTLRIEGDTAMEVRAGYGLFEEERGLRVELGQGALGMAAQRREGVLVNDYQAWEPRHQGLIRRQGDRPVRAIVACPLLIRDEVIGALSVGVFDPERRFTEADLERLTSLAAPVALAIEHSRLYDELGARLRELQETQAQLVQAAKLSAVGQLVSGVAHELNNPLAVVIGYGQLMLSRELPEPHRKPVELMLSQADRMAKIVQGLLLFSRQQKPTRGAVEIARVIDQILELRTAQLRLSGIEVAVEHEEPGVRATGDAHQLQQVFLNLILNAEQAILGSGVGNAIRVRTWTRAEGERAVGDGTARWTGDGPPPRELLEGAGRVPPDGARRAVVEIIDNGPGIPADVLPRVFDPFFTTKPVGQGTGLGLSVSYGIVEQHGGQLRVESRPGHTVFTVELPVDGTRDGASAAIFTGPRAVGQGRHALVVEDEPDLSDLVTTLLRQTGWRVDVAAGGRPALERVRGTAYDLIVSDIRMPDGSGADFYRAATSERKDLAGRFLFVTGDTANADSWKFLEETRAPVLEKPFSADELLRTVEKLVLERLVS